MKRFYVDQNEDNTDDELDLSVTLSSECSSIDENLSSVDTSTTSTTSSSASTSSQKKKRKKEKHKKNCSKSKTNDDNNNQDDENEEVEILDDLGNLKKSSKSKRNTVPNPPNYKKSKTQKECEKLRSEIELKNLKNHMTYIDKELSLKKKREILKIEDEIEHYDLHMKRKRLNNRVDLINAKLSLKSKELELKNWTENDPEYARNPLRKGPNGETELVISDRTIELNGAITYYTSDYVCDRIHYYNNQNDKHPIFLMIDYSPGGSVMAGYRILKAMKSSSSPIYVVVKSFAASMAATILTLADHGYVYKNAIVLHHQMWCRNSGNIMQQRDQTKEINEWWDRLAGPVISKLKLKSKEDWITMMYEHNVDGDWSEFGDNAVKERWAKGVIDRIRETGRVKHPDSISRFFFFNSTSSPPSNKNDTLIDKYTLPRLKPFDLYWLYDRKKEYKIDGSQ